MINYYIITEAGRAAYCLSILTGKPCHALFGNDDLTATAPYCHGTYALSQIAHIPITTAKDLDDTCCTGSLWGALRHGWIRKLTYAETVLYTLRGTL